MLTYICMCVKYCKIKLIVQKVCEKNENNNLPSTSCGDSSLF